MLRITPPLAVALSFFISATNCPAHIIGDPAHDGHPVQYVANVSPPTKVIKLSLTSGVADATDRAAQIARAFQPFAAKVKTHSDGTFFFIESDGIPAHNMMVGITTWQQQVPLPQSYFGENAWRFPITPVPAAQPQSIKNHFLRGAIAIAANGIPIFNPQNNRGEISAEIGELDQWGGHCGRADDYHYHAAPLHLQSAVGKTLPIAYALDGYAIYGLAEPDGSAPGALDRFNGHSTAKSGYHYHASTKYPYVNGGFHGEVSEVEQQVDPQPRAQSVRQDQPPLRGARITAFTNSPDQKTFSLKYSVNGKSGGVNYSKSENDTWKFQFTSTDGTIRDETYRTRERRGGNGTLRERDNGAPSERLRRDGNHPPPEHSEAQREAVSITPPVILKVKRSGNFTLSSLIVTNGGALPAEFNGDGEGASPPLEWKGAPAGTKSFALVMDHLAPGNVMKCDWTMWDIPAHVTNLPKNANDIGKPGLSFKGQPGYEPPHSQGPGVKTYTLHVYALSMAPPLNPLSREVTREVLLEAIKDSILDSAELEVTYTQPEKVK